jgi:hypothetical protein
LEDVVAVVAVAAGAALAVGVVEEVGVAAEGPETRAHPIRS